MSKSFPKYLKLTLIMLILFSIMYFTLSCAPNTDQYYQMSAEEFKDYQPANETIDYNNVNYYLLNAAIFHDTNLIRQENSVALLDYSKALERAAQGHSEQMIKQDFFAHDNPNNGETPFDRMADEGVTEGYRGENIAGSSWQTWTYNELAEMFVHGMWWNSSGHRENMLNENFKYLGVGTYTGTTTFFGAEYDTVVATQNFGSIVPE
jgi:uncharacterized protein YkwD